MPNTPSPEFGPLVTGIRRVHERGWNALIPGCAIDIKVLPNVGVRYLHPTKGERYISRRRFAIRGIY